MSLVDTTEVQCLEVIATATALPNVFNNSAATSNSCPSEGWRNQYNREVAVLTNKMAEVRERIASIHTLQAEVSRIARQSHQTLSDIERSLAARPPAKAPGTVIPLDINVEMARALRWPPQYMPIDGKIEVVLAHFIPQSRANDIVYDQIVPTHYLKGLGSPLTGKNGCQLYTTNGRRNSRAMKRLQNGARETFGDTFWMPSPLETESWLSLIIDQPSHDIMTAVEMLNNQSVYRFTIDNLFDGRQLLSFAKEKDQLLAKMALS
ncbi:MULTISPECIES: hypothetical protein [unclassified Tardiphaga]|uniref:hypothetical protein n=1 Tax=unclassified Tardiphaga TaxID=2631404 RepID=UPI001163E608|nr:MULTISPECIES: hypothetical protein [unclassified Tardiphaga]QDM15541.1 hypothetical protein FNL53_06110 [Tardiphaga sp. vice278]QDM20606.1 hypothetical protein FIU28_05295 [Tardiphaga sp. vice154]